MKKFFCLVCVAALILSACSAPEPETTEPEQTVSNTQGIYELTFEEQRVSEDRVGNDWIITYRYNREIVKSGCKIRLPLGVFSFQTVEIEVRENDKLDDVGTGTMHVAICDGGSGQTTVVVKENGGRYKGGEAVWEITCTVKLIGKQ